MGPSLLAHGSEGVLVRGLCQKFRSSVVERASLRGLQPLPQGPRVSIVPCAAKHYLRAGERGGGCCAAWVCLQLGGLSWGSRAEQPPARAKGWARALLPDPSPSTGEFLLLSGRDRACASSWGAVDLCEQRLPFSGASSGRAEGKCSSPSSRLQQLKAFQVSTSLPPQS